MHGVGMSTNLDSVRRALLAMSESAQSPDEVEDYYHDGIVIALEKQKDLEEWARYIYASVKRRIGYGREAKQHLQLNEEITEDTRHASLTLQIDILRALEQLSTVRKNYIYNYFYEGYTLEEIAVKYKVSPQVVSKVIGRGLKEMKKILTKKPVV